MNIKDKVIEISKLLDELDLHAEDLPSKHSTIDSKICDLLHLVESKKLNTAQCYRVVRELHKARIERREIKNDEELMRVYKIGQNKLLGVEHRKFLIADLSKTEKALTTSIYKNRVLTDDEIKEILGE